MRLVFALICFLPCAACSAFPPEAPQAAGIAEKRTSWLAPGDPGALVVAHRGCWQTTAENSIAAIDACVVLGVDLVEIDVRRTHDGALVLMHDETVDRTTDGSGRVDELTLAEVRTLRLRRGGGGATAPLTTAGVPTFEEAMRAASGRLLINLDAKEDVYDDAFALLDRLGMSDHVVMKRRIQVGDAPLASRAPFDRVLSMPIIDQASGAAEILLASQKEVIPSAVEVIFTDIVYLETAVPAIQRMGARVWVNTLRPQFSAGLVDAEAVTDPDAVWGLLINMGVDTIQTDEPEALIRYLQARGLR